MDTNYIWLSKAGIRYLFHLRGKQCGGFFRDNLDKNTISLLFSLENDLLAQVKIEDLGIEDQYVSRGDPFRS